MCKTLEVSKSGYYAWNKRPPSKTENERTHIGFALLNLHQASRGLYGAPRLHRGLILAGMKCSRNRLVSIMKEFGIRSKMKRKFKATTNSRHKLPVAENVLARAFTPTTPNQVLASDITYISTGEGWLYLAVVMDLYSRKIVGWSMAEHMRKELTLDALNGALSQRNLIAGAIHHSDRGVQYASHSYQKRLRDAGLLCSMSRKGDCYDNAVVESFFGSLKTELVYLNRFKTRAEAKQQIFEYIEVFYNRQRLHSSLGFLSPVDYEAQLLVA
jgi:putative transposase